MCEGLSTQPAVNKRHEFVDIMRGIGIILVVLGHSIGFMSENLNIFILSFHMPLFFFISGMLLSTKNSFKAFLKKRAIGILIPHVILSVLMIVESIIFDVFLFHRFSLWEVNYLVIFQSWFLPTLFFMEIVCYGILKLSEKGRFVLPAAILVFCVAFILTSYNGIQYVQQVLCATFFGLVGIAIKSFLLSDKASNIIKYSCCGLFLIPALAILSSFNLPVGMYMNQYGNKIVFLTTSFLGIAATFVIAKTINKNQALEFFGKNSIYIYVTQAFVLRCIMGVVNRLPFVNMNVSSYPYYFIVFILAMLVEIVLILCINKLKHFKKADSDKKILL